MGDMRQCWSVGLGRTGQKHQIHQFSQLVLDAASCLPGVCAAQCCCSACNQQRNTTPSTLLLHCCTAALQATLLRLYDQPAVSVMGCCSVALLGVLQDVLGRSIIVGPSCAGAYPANVHTDVWLPNRQCKVGAVALCARPRQNMCCFQAAKLPAMVVDCEHASHMASTCPTCWQQQTMQPTAVRFCR
jgi:hypothetical protein